MFGNRWSLHFCICVNLHRWRNPELQAYKCQFSLIMVIFSRDCLYERGTCGANGGVEGAGCLLIGDCNVKHDSMMLELEVIMKRSRTFHYIHLATAHDVTGPILASVLSSACVF